jgi:hypothetical protein
MRGAREYLVGLGFQDMHEDINRARRWFLSTALCNGSLRKT